VFHYTNIPQKICKNTIQSQLRRIVIALNETVVSYFCLIAITIHSLLLSTINVHTSLTSKTTTKQLTLRVLIVLLWQPWFTCHQRPPMTVKIKQKRLASGVRPQTPPGSSQRFPIPLDGGRGLATPSQKSLPISTVGLSLALRAHQLAAPRICSGFVTNTLHQF